MTNRRSTTKQWKARQGHTRAGSAVNGKTAAPGQRKRPPTSRPGPAKGKQRSRPWGAWVAIGAVVAVVVAFAIVKASNQPAPAASASLAPASVVSDVTTVPAAAFDAVGVGADVATPKPLPKGTPPLLRSGLPQVVYVGAEYCPYCAAERWAVVVALSRFGTFSRLGATESSTTDVYPGTKTFSFYGSGYTSPYLRFTSAELESNQPAAGGGYTDLQQPSALEQRLLETFDRAPYATTAGAIPFIDIGNRYVISGTMYDPGLLQGLSMPAIAHQLQDPSSPVAKAILGSANLITAAICAATGDQPSAVCSSSAVVAANDRLGAS